MDAPAISFEKKHAGLSPIDGMTPVHFGIGYIAGLSNMNPSWAMFSVIAFQAFLKVLEAGSVSAVFEKQSSQSYGNQAIESLMGIVGVYAGERSRQRKLRLLSDAEYQAALRAYEERERQFQDMSGVRR